jgi:methionine-rich copper-binding protein CopC
MRRVLLAVAAVLAVLLPGTPAWAHTSLLSSAPARDATLDKAPASVALRFSQKLNPDFTTIVVTDTALHRIPASAPAIDQATGTVTLQQALTNGTYTVAYRVVSTDGHTVQGKYAFTVADPALPSATSAGPSAGPSAATAAAPASTDGGMPTGVLIGLAAAGLLFAAAAFYFYRSGRRRAATN